MNLKKGVDHIGVSVVYFCHDGQGNVLFAKRSQNARDEKGIWDIGGGGVEFGDTVEATLRKEIKEEYNADVLDFKVLVDPKQVKINEPHKFDDIGWFDLAHLPDPLHSQHAYFFEKYKDKLN